MKPLQFTKFKGVPSETRGRQPTELYLAIADLQPGEGLNIKNRSQCHVTTAAANVRKRFPMRRFCGRKQNDGSVNIYRVADAKKEEQA